MKRLGFFTKLAAKRATAIRYGLAGFACSFFAFVTYSVGVPVWKEFQTSFAYREFKEYGVLGTYQRRFFGSFGKFKDLEKMDRENHELNTRLALLERDYELERARNASAEMKEITEELSYRIQNEGGSELARVLAAITYQVPTHLLPHQLYALALGYFRKGEYEQAAVLFNHLLNLTDDTSYQRHEVRLLSAMTWYHLKHYKLAKSHLRSVVKGANPSSSLYRTAVLWQAILAKAEGKKTDSQRYLTAALAQFPHSVEATWINRKPARTEREPNQALVNRREHEHEDAKEHQAETEKARHHDAVEHKPDHGSGERGKNHE